MAKAYYTCATCGAQCICFSTSGKQAQSRARWLEKQGELCDDCKAAQREQSKIAAQKNAANDLPALSGTDKQVAWAETLRENRMGNLDLISTLFNGEELPSDTPSIKAFYARSEFGDLQNQRVDADTWAVFCELLVDQAKASWWIDNQKLTAAGLMHSMRALIVGKIMAVKEAAPEPDADVLLMPEQRNDCPHIAELGISTSNAITAVLPAKNEPFRLLMHAQGFKWDKSRWVRALTPMTGSAKERIAELAHALMAAGFMVSIHDQEARELAKSGAFEPEHRNWFSAVVKGPMAGWFLASWGRQDDYYSALRALSGSRFNQGHLYLPASSADEVQEFAEVHGFRLTPGAQALVKEYHAAIAAGAVVEVKPGQAPRLVRIDEVPAVLPVPECVEVADDLLDDH